MAEDLGCSKPTCTKVIKELDSDNGIGLIEKKRRGLGKPDIIYVKNFASVPDERNVEKAANTDISTEVKNFNFKKEKNLTSGSKETELQEIKNFDFKKEKNLTSGSKETEFQEIKNFDFKKEKNLTSRDKKTELQEVKEFAPNYNNTNYNNQNYNNESYTNPINQSVADVNNPVDVRGNL